MINEKNLYVFIAVSVFVFKPELRKLFEIKKVFVFISRTISFCAVYILFKFDAQNSDAIRLNWILLQFQYNSKHKPLKFYFLRKTFEIIFFTYIQAHFDWYYVPE